MTPPDPGPIRRVLGLFRAALDVPPEERSNFIRAHSGGDVGMERRVLRMLRFDSTPPPRLSGAPVGAGAPAQELPSRLADRYVVRRFLGRGGMGRVVLARDDLLDRDVAVKIIDSAHGREARTRVVAEARAASAVDDPHVCPVYDVASDDDGRLYIVMAHCEGETLRVRLDDGPLHPQEAARVALQVAKGLAAAHAQGIVHRDVKPANIALTPTGAKVLDFGIAGGARGSLSSDRPGAGTLAYMSPERLAGQRGDVRGDIWSLGMVLREMITASLPVPVAPGDPHPCGPSARGESELESITRRMLDPDPDRRLQSMTDVVRALEPLAHPGRTGVKGPSAFGAIALAGGAVVAAGALIALAMGSGERTPARGDGPTLEDSRAIVLPFENRTGVDSLALVGEWAATWIGHGLMRAGVARVVAPEAALAGSGAGGGGRPENGTDRALDLARAFGARLLVVGAVFREGSRLELHTRIVDASTGRVVRTLEPVDGTVAEPSMGFVALRTRAVAAVATLTGSGFSDFTAIQSQPPTYQAYQEFSRGSTLFAASRFDEAVPYFIRASALDPSYTLPVLYRAHANVNAGSVRQVGHRLEPVDSLLALVQSRRDELPPYDLHFLDLSRAVLTPYPDWEAGLRAARELHRIAPGARTDFDVGANLVRLNRPGEAIEFFATLDPTRGEQRHWMPYWRMLTAAHHVLGQHADEERVARRARALDPFGETALALSLRALAAQGRGERVIHAVDSLLDHARPDGGVPATLVAEEALLELAVHGGSADVAGVHRLLAPRLEAALGRDPWVAEDLLFAHVTAGEWERALDVLDASRPPDSPPWRGLEGIVWARTGRTDEAEARLAELLADTTGAYDVGRRVYWNRGDRHPKRWAAEVAASLGDADRAVAILRAAIGEGLPQGTWMHVAPGLRLLRGEPSYEALRAPGD